METLVANNIKLDEFKFLIGYLDLSDIQERLESYHVSEPTYNSSVALEKHDFHLSFDVELITSYKEKAFSSGISIENVSLTNIELWYEEDAIELDEQIISELYKTVTNQIKSFI